MQCLEDRCQTVGLLLVVRQDIDGVAHLQLVGYILHEQFELLVEQRLRQGIESDTRVGVVRTLGANLDCLAPGLSLCVGQ